MHVSLTQSEVTAAIAVYLASKGMAQVKPADLNIVYSFTRKGEDAGVHADFDISDEAGRSVDAVKATEVKATTNPGNTSTGGLTVAEDAPAPEVANEAPATEAEAPAAETGLFS